MRYVSLWLLFVSAANAQIILQGKTTGPIVDYLSAHPGVLNGDTVYCVQTAATYANGASAGTSVLNLNNGAGNQTIAGKVFCTINDGFTSAGAGNIGSYNLTVLDMGSAANTTAVGLNQMASFGTNPGATNVPAGWSGQGTSGHGSGYDWKSGKQISVGGWIVLPVHRQGVAAYYQTGDLTLIASPDGGLHWCNPYTFANHTTAPGCDSANWKADGDAPLAPADASYTATPSSIMWKDQSPYDGTTNRAGRLYFFDYCQDNACTGSPHGADAYLYAFASTGRQTKFILGRVLKNIGSIMDVTAWQWYTCANYSVTNVCDGTVSGNWTGTPANATLLFAGDGVDASGSGQNINPNLTNQMGTMFGSPTYYCANGGCAYVQTNYRLSLGGGSGPGGRSGIMAFPAPWGPFTPFNSEFVNPIAGFWSILRYTLSTPDSQPYHARFVTSGDNPNPLFFQAFDLTVGSNQSGMNLAGCAQYRFAWSPVAGAIIRRGLWGFWDFFSHGCFDHRVGNIYNPSIYANDISTYPSDKQLIGCFTDGAVTCAIPSLGKGISWSTTGIDIETTYSPRLEARDMVPGVYNAITASPFTSAADPAWTISYVLKPSNISTNFQGLLEVGTTGKAYVYASLGSAGKVGVSWAWPNYVVTSSAVLSVGTWAYVTITKSPGASGACAAIPCAAATVHIYVNGAEVLTTSSGSGTPAMQAGPLTVGFVQGNDSFRGSLAGLEIYSRALSAPEVAHNYKTHQARLLASRGIVIP